MSRADFIALVPAGLDYFNTMSGEYNPVEVVTGTGQVMSAVYSAVAPEFAFGMAGLSAGLSAIDVPPLAVLRAC